MAIDSAAKRKSVLFFFGHRKGRLIPDGTISSVDKQDIVGFYRGIAASAVGLFTVTLESVSTPQPTVTPSVSQPTVTETVKNRIG
jgi:hypothetical protein